MFEPENDLERSLMKAAHDPAHRPQFYRDLLNSWIYIIHTGDEPLDIQNGVIQQGRKIQLHAWQRDGEDWLPIFSSLTRLRQNLQSEARYLHLRAVDFFELTGSSNVCLNPNLDYGKEFTVAEIGRLLDGTLFHADQSYTVERESSVLLGQPATYPVQLINAVSRLFARLPHVRAAYLAHYFNPERDEVAHSLIGIDASGDWDKIVGDAGIVAKEVLSNGEFVEFVRVSPDDAGVSQYLLHETIPFYTKAPGHGLFR